jgi:hypothetical protein
LPSITSQNGFRSTSVGKAQTRRAFRALAFWTQERPQPSDDAGNQNGNFGDTTGHDTELANILDAIAQDVARMSAAACATAMAEYAGAVDSARKQFPKNLIAGIIRGLKDALRAKLAEIRKVAKADLAGRREAAIRAHRRRFRTTSRQPPEGPHRK